jgi:hypothetical protein
VRALRRQQLSEKKSEDEHQNEREQPPQPAAVFLDLFRRRILCAALRAEARVGAEFSSAIRTKRCHPGIPRKISLFLKTGMPAGNRHGGIAQRFWFL